MVGQTLFTRLVGEGTLLSKDKFLSFWLPRKLVSAAPVERVFHCLKQDGQEVRGQLLDPAALRWAYAQHETCSAALACLRMAY